MSKDELVSELGERFRDIAQVYSLSPYKIEIDVSTNVDKSEWQERLKGLDLVDNSKHINDSYRHNDIVIQLFRGNISRFRSKSGL